MSMEEIGKALGRVHSGLFILTAYYEGLDEAVLVSWVNQCSFEPPTLSVVLGQDRPARQIIEASRAFILNVLGKEDFDILKRFSRPPENGSIFEGLEIQRGYQNTAILKDTVSYMECEFLKTVSVEDHFIYVGKIVGGHTLKGGDPYVHIRKSGLSY